MALKIHVSEYEKQGWINLNNIKAGLPAVKVRVRVACIELIDWNIETLRWESTGYITPSGDWMIKGIVNYSVINQLRNPFTHWKPL